MENPFIMVIGCPRSGTTMIRNMLTSHPEVFIFPQTQFINKIWGARRLYDFSKNRPRMLGVISEDRAVKRAGLNLFSSEKGRKKTFDDYFSEYIALIEEYNFENKKYIGDKTPRHAMFIDTLVNHLPAKLKVIAIVRDSRAVVASMKQRELIKKVENGSLLWNSFAKYIRRMTHSLPQSSWLLLRYEDIISDPENCSARLTDFLSIDYSKKMLEIEGNNSSFQPSKNRGIYTDSLHFWKTK